MEDLTKVFPEDVTLSYTPEEFKQKVAEGMFQFDTARLVATVQEVAAQGKLFKDVLRCICVSSGKDIVCGKAAIKAMTPSHRMLVRDEGSMWIIRCAVQKSEILQP